MEAARVYRKSTDRRREILDATIGALAEHGYTGATFERIRENAQLSSTRMISYHFADKAALMAAVVETVVTDAAAQMVPAMGREETLRGKLAAYIRSNLRYLADNRAAARAVIEVISNAPRADSSLREDTSALLLALLLTQGQEAGELRDFDAAVVARSIRATIDAFATRMPEGQAATLRAIDEIVALYDRATRPEGH
ncbi:TetR/AcrR family transcriptional regulator [Cellulomonas sp. URHE0023]|uniref:TetR/AcrR family transcriptional regulator n=1 Tax=Cellulomonas sp. URHE0023 TaxID=1380354 RepID=UPI00047FE45B|nr:TetR family transcriptional regulator [Cellulomonas sp. URHE0023]